MAVELYYPLSPSHTCPDVYDVSRGKANAFESPRAGVKHASEALLCANTNGMRSTPTDP